VSFWKDSLSSTVKEVPLWVLPSCGWLVLLHRYHLGVSVSVFSICSNCDLTILTRFLFILVNLFIYVYLYFNNLCVWEKIYYLNGKIWLTTGHTQWWEWLNEVLEMQAMHQMDLWFFFFPIVLISKYWMLNRTKRYNFFISQLNDLYKATWTVTNK